MAVTMTAANHWQTATMTVANVTANPGMEMATPGQIEIPMDTTTMAADQTATMMAVDQTVTMTAANQTATMDKRATMTVATVDQTPLMTTTDQMAPITTAGQIAIATSTSSDNPASLVDQRADIYSDTTITAAGQIAIATSTSSANPASLVDQRADIYSDTTIAAARQIAIATSTSSDNPASLVDQRADIYSDMTTAEATNVDTEYPNTSLIEDSRDGVHLTANSAASLRTVEQTTMVSANPPASVDPPNVGTGKKKAGIMRPNPLSTTAR
jgi:hypothetical protein